MSTEMQTKVQASPAQNFTPVQTGLLQRKSALCNTPGLVEDSGQDKEKLTLQRSALDQAGTTTVPPFGHDFSRLKVHSTGSGLIQTKLKINEPGDLYEQEADRVAEQVMRMEEPRVQHQEEMEEGEEAMQYKPLVGQTPEVTPAISSGIQSLQGGGRALSGSERGFFEPRFGTDFSNVRVHNDTRAASVARSVNARAFTHGHNVVFGAGEYSSGALAGRKLLAHELTHVVQQNGGSTLFFSEGKDSENTIPNSQELSIVYSEFPFGKGEYAPHTELERPLLVHELTHVVQQSRTNFLAAPAIPTLQRQPKPDESDPEPFRLGRTNIKVIPGRRIEDDEAIKVLGFKVPFESLRLSNELDLSLLPGLPKNLIDAQVALAKILLSGTLPPPRPEDRSLLSPRFTVDVSRNQFRLGVTDAVPLKLHPDVVQGTPIDKTVAVENEKVFKVKDPFVSIGPNRITAIGNLQLGGDYPFQPGGPGFLGVTGPWEISFVLQSPPLRITRLKEKRDELRPDEPFSLRASAYSDFMTLSASGPAVIDNDRLDQHLSSLGLSVEESTNLRKDIVKLMRTEFPVVRDAVLSRDPVAGALAALRVEAKIKELILERAPPGTTEADVRKVESEIAVEFARPGFDVRVRTQLAPIPGIGRFRAQTTRSVRRQLAGSTLPLPFPHWFWFVGPIAINSREFSDVIIPAVGGIAEISGETAGASAFVAGIPFVSSGSGGGRGIAELKAVVRLPGEFDLGARFTVLFEKRLFSREGVSADKKIGEGDFLRQQSLLKKEGELEGLPPGVHSNPRPGTDQRFPLSFFVSLERPF